VKGAYIDRYSNIHYMNGEAIASGDYGDVSLQHYATCEKCKREIPTEYPTNSVGYVCDACKLLQPIHDKLDRIIEYLEKEEVKHESPRDKRVD